MCCRICIRTRADKALSCCVHRSLPGTYVPRGAPGDAQCPEKAKWELGSVREIGGPGGVVLAFWVSSCVSVFLHEYIYIYI